MGLWAWIKQRFTKRVVGEAVIVIRPSPEQYELLLWWSQRNGSPLDELLLHGGIMAIPLAERRRFVARKAYVPLLEAADDALDNAEPLLARGVFPLPPEKHVAQEPLPESSVPDKALWKEGHPCVFLVTRTQETLANWPSAVDAPCVGVCWHEDQRGKPCHWEANAAPHCTLYQARVVRKGL